MPSFLKMDVQFTSREVIKPSSEDIHDWKPFKLSLLDQFSPEIYFPITLFYQGSDEQPDIAEISARLRRSLSETLSTFYLFTGRLKNELYVDNYEEGIPFAETKVNISLSDFLRHPQINKLNIFLPCAPYARLSNSEAAPLIAVQLNTFECGGIALGVSFMHKVFDGATASAFLKSWTNNSISGSNTQRINPNILEAPWRFPSIDESSFRARLSLTMSRIWFDEGKRSVRRFVFDAKAIATLRGKARSERVCNPSRIETVSSFIWKSMSAAARKVSDLPRTSLSAHVVNLRQRTLPRLPGDSIGNVLLLAIAACDLANTDQMRLHDLVALTREAIAKINPEVLSQWEGEKGHQSASQLVDCLEEVQSQRPEFFFFTSWLHMGFNELEFGWGKPLWSGILGGVAPACYNSTIFKETGSNGEDLEAWIILDETKMAILERDPEFLAFATLNPSALPY